MGSATVAKKSTVAQEVEDREIIARPVVCCASCLTLRAYRRVKHSYPALILYSP